MQGRLVPDPGSAVGAIQIPLPGYDQDPRLVRVIGVSHNADSNVFYYRPLYAFLPRLAGPIEYDGIKLPPIVQRLRAKDGQNQLELSFSVKVYDDQFTKTVRRWLIDYHTSLWQEVYSEDNIPVEPWLLARASVICKRRGSDQVFGTGVSALYEATAASPIINFHIQVDRWLLEEFALADKEGELEFQLFDVSQVRDQHKVEIRSSAEIDLTAELGAMLGQTPKEGDTLTQHQYEQLLTQLQLKIEKRISVSDPNLVPFALQETSRVLLDGILQRLPGSAAGTLIAPPEVDKSFAEQRAPGSEVKTDHVEERDLTRTIDSQSVGGNAGIGATGPSVGVSASQTKSTEHETGTVKQSGTTTSKVTPTDFAAYKLIALPAKVKIADDNRIFVGAAFRYDQVASNPVSSLFTTDVLKNAVAVEVEPMLLNGPFLGEYRFVARKELPHGWQWCEEAVFPDAAVIPEHLRGKQHPDPRGLLLGIASDAEGESSTVAAAGLLTIPELQSQPHRHAMHGPMLALPKKLIVVGDLPNRNYETCTDDGTWGVYCPSSVPGGREEGWAFTGVIATEQPPPRNNSKDMTDIVVQTVPQDTSVTSASNPPNLRMRCMIFLGK